MTGEGAAPGFWPAALAGACGMLVGIGLARFAYTPLIPAVIIAGWFSPAQAAYLGAANLTGYLAGAVGARRVVRRWPAATALRTAMVLATLSFFACAQPVAFDWFFLWRFVAGAAGGVIMVLAPPAVLALVPASRRGFAGGVVFTGIGIGIALSGLVVPPLLRLGLPAAWLGLGALAAVLTAASWTGWATGLPAIAARRPRAGGAVLVIITEYGLNAFGVVPHMIFLVDFVARGLGLGMAEGAACWVAFGIGALAGPAFAGMLADRIGFRLALRLVLLAEAIAVLAPAIATAPAVLLASAVVVGALTPGVVPLALGRIHMVLAPGTEAARAAWSGATIAWAIGQAIGAQAMAAIFAGTASYTPLFLTGAAALLVALVLDGASARRTA